MKVRGKMAVLGCLSLLFSLRLMAQQKATFECPDSISPTTPELTKPVEGWIVFLDTSPHRLSRVTFFDGPIEENASLVPNKDTRTGKTRTAKWLLQPNAKRPYWLACYYSGTSLALSRILPSGLSECAVTYNTAVQVAGVPEIRSFSCH